MGAHEAVLVVQLSVAVDNTLGGGEAGLAALAHGIGQGIGHVTGREEGKGRSGLEGRTRWTRFLG